MEGEKERGGESAAHLLPEDAGLMCLARHQINHFRASEVDLAELSTTLRYHPRMVIANAGFSLEDKTTWCLALWP